MNKLILQSSSFSPVLSNPRIWMPQTIPWPTASTRAKDLYVGASPSQPLPKPGRTCRQNGYLEPKRCFPCAIANCVSSPTVPF